MENIDAKKLSESLSNFYSEYGYEDLNIQFFVDLYLEMADALEEYLTAIKRNQTVKSMATFRKYNFAVLNGHMAGYNLETILLSPETCLLAGISGSMAEKKASWELVPFKIKATVLTRLGHYISLSAKRPLDDVEPEIMTLDIEDLSGNPYIDGIDYFLYENKIFLIGGSEVAVVKNEKLIATNIYVNYRTPEILLGSRIGIGYSASVSYPEYRDFLQMVTHVLIKGPTVANLKAAFNMLAGWEGSNIVDMTGADSIRSALWTNPVTAILTPFDFLVTIPAAVANTVGFDEDGYLVAKSDRLDVFKTFIDIVKPSDTNYIMALSNTIIESIFNTDLTRLSVAVPISDSRPAKDSTMNNVKVAFVEDFRAMKVLAAARFDSGSLFDNDEGYDESSLDRNVTMRLSDYAHEYLATMTHGELARESIEKMAYGDIMTINVINYPEFPVSFTAVKDILSGVVTCTFKDNAESVNGYHIYRNGSIINTIIPANADNSIKTYSDLAAPALPPGTYVYLAKSFYTIGATEYYSRPSKIVTIIK